MEWISVKDRLPENDGSRSDDVIVTVADSYGHKDVCPAFMSKSVYGEKFVWKYTDGYERIERIGVRVSHWMPLPDPPEDENI